MKIISHNAKNPWCTTQEGILWISNIIVVLLGFLAFAGGFCMILECYFDYYIGIISHENSCTDMQYIFGPLNFFMGIGAIFISTLILRYETKLKLKNSESIT